MITVRHFERALGRGPWLSSRQGNWNGVGKINTSIRNGTIQIISISTALNLQSAHKQSDNFGIIGSEVNARHANPLLLWGVVNDDQLEVQRVVAASRVREMPPGPHLLIPEHLRSLGDLLPNVVCESAWGPDADRRVKRLRSLV